MYSSFSFSSNEFASTNDAISSRDESNPNNALNSHLSDSKYGYDFVVATTQASINATMKEYLSSLQDNEVKICYVADQEGAPQAIDYDQLLTNAHGSDPFSIPASADATTNSNILNLYGARFMFGFKAQIGVPSGIAPQDIPDIVGLGQGTASVLFNLMCSEFQIVQYTPASGYNSAHWMNQSQPTDQPWLFTSKVDLRLSQAEQGAYSKLPPAVQTQIHNIGGNAFSIQQLFFDLDNAALESTPTILGVPSNDPLYGCLQNDFINTYFKQMRHQGSPVLGYTITQSAAVDQSTLTLTDLNFEVSPYNGSNGQPISSPSNSQQNLTTLCYLCAANGNHLPAAVPFTWNWVNEGENSSFDGVVSINRNSFAQYLASIIKPQILQNCYSTSVTVTLVDAGFGGTHYSWSLTPRQTPQVIFPAAGNSILQMNYSSHAGDSAGATDDYQMALSPSYTLDASVNGNQITITQKLVVGCYIQSMHDGASGNVVDKTIVDTLTLAVDATGNITYTPTSATTDNSQTPSINGFCSFFTGELVA